LLSGRNLAYQPT